MDYSTMVIQQTFGYQAKLPANLRVGDTFTRQAYMQGYHLKGKAVRFEVRNAYEHPEEEPLRAPRKCIVGVMDGHEVRVYPR